MIKKLIRKIIERINAPILAQLNKPEKPEYLKEIEKAYRAGYNYHQKKIKNDPELLEWVLKENYFNDCYKNK